VIRPQASVFPALNDKKMNSEHQSKGKQTDDVLTNENRPDETFAETNVRQLRDAVEQVVYGDIEPDKSKDPDRAHTVEALTTLGQMGELTEMDLDEAKKGYL
jgi:hypothetical protein